MVAVTRQEQRNPCPTLAPDGRPRCERDHVFFARMLSGGIGDKAQEAYEALGDGQRGVAYDAVNEARLYALEVVGHLKRRRRRSTPRSAARCWSGADDEH